MTCNKVEKTLCQSEKKIESLFCLIVVSIPGNKLHKSDPERNIEGMQTRVKTSAGSHLQLFF
jgi:hypothetical protein